MFYFGRDDPFTSKKGLPKITQKSSRSLPKQQSSNHQFSSLEKRINDLEGSLKMIEKKYRSNLKQGFDNKIKSFRLQAVMERKLIQKSIQQTKNDIEAEEVKQKSHRAEKMRIQELQRLANIAERKRIQLDRMKAKQERQKQYLQKKVKEENEAKQIMNKQMHNKICEEYHNRGRKKQYFMKLREEKKRWETSEEKRKLAHKIISNQDQLQSLKFTLAEFQQKMGTHAKDLTFMTI